MAELLTDLLEAGLIQKLDGNDERFEKIERAAGALAQELCANPPALIRAILAGLDPDIPPDDPAIAMAERVLLVEWKSVRSVFPDTPVGLLRVILLEACRQAADKGNNTAILWLTAADTLSFLRLGRENTVAQQILFEWAINMEKNALGIHTVSKGCLGQLMLKVPEPKKLTKIETDKIDREDLLKKLLAATGPQSRSQKVKLTNPNPHWSYSGNAEWSWEFSDRMRNLLADELDVVTSDLSAFQEEVEQHLDAFQTELIRILNESLNAQQHWLQESRPQSDQIRLNALWWSESLYSPSLRQSYRELPPPLAAAIMAVDLLAEVAKPTPASVGYLLAEAVNRLPEAGFDRKFTLTELFRALHEARGQLHNDWLKPLLPPPEQGRLSLRDAAWLALSGQAQDLATLIRRTGASADAAMSLPAFAHALFRQEQAVQLAGSGIQ